MQIFEAVASDGFYKKLSLIFWPEPQSFKAFVAIIKWYVQVCVTWLIYRGQFTAVAEVENVWIYNYYVD